MSDILRFPGSFDNPFLSLINEMDNRIPSAAEIEYRSRELFDSGVGLNEIRDVIREFDNLSLSPTQVDALAKLMADVAGRHDDAEMASEIHYWAGDVLDRGFDSETLRLAIWHYQQVQNAEALIPAKLNEAAASYKLAHMSANAVALLNEALVLCAYAETHVAAGSPEHSFVLPLRARCLLELATRGVDARRNLAKAVSIFDGIMNSPSSATSAVGKAMCGKAGALQLRSEFNADDFTLQFEAIAICEVAKGKIDRLEDPVDLSQVYGTERKSRLALARMGIDAEEHIHLALLAIENEIDLIQTHPNLIAPARNQEATAYRLLGELCLENVEYNLKCGIRAARSVRGLGRVSQLDIYTSSLTEAQCHQLLAEHSISPAENLKAALDLVCQAVEIGTEISGLKVMGAVTEATIRRLLAEYGIDAVNNLRTAIQRCTETEGTVVDSLAVSEAAGARTHRRTLRVARGFALARLADLGIDRVANFKLASELLAEFGNELAPNDIESMKARLDEATTYRKLAIAGVDAAPNLDRAILSANAVLLATENASNQTTRIEKLNRQALGELGAIYGTRGRMSFSVGPVDDFRKAVNYLQRAIAEAPTGTRELAVLSMNLGTSCLGLSQLGSNPIDNAEKAAESFGRASAFFVEGSAEWGQCQSHLSDAMSWLDDERAIERLSESISVLENVRWQLSNETDRIAYIRTVFDKYRRIVQKVLEYADTADAPDIRRRHVISAWDWIHQAKGRAFLELMQQTRSNESLAKPVPQPVAIIGSLRDSHQNQRCVLIEFFAFGTEELAIFVVPLWDLDEIVYRKIKIDSKDVNRLIMQMAIENESTEFGDPFPNFPEDLAVFFEPISGILEELNPANLILSPHFYLSYLPLHAAKLGNQMVIERWPVSYLPTPAVICEMHLNEEGVGQEAVIAGDPQDNLPFTAVEAKNISRMFTDEGIPTHLLIGPEAIEAAIRGRLDNAAVLHLSCHGVLEPEFELAGFELADGRVTVKDLMTWNMRSTSVAFLSTCLSGMSLSGETDDYLALSRCFFAAGVRSVIANLWVASEAVGECFAMNLYRAWMLDEQPLNAAYRTATLATMELYPEPRHWASFVLVGLADPPRPSGA